MVTAVAWVRSLVWELPHAVGVAKKQKTKNQQTKKNEIKSSAATWMDLEGNMLSEISQTEKDKNYISLICAI